MIIYGKNSVLEALKSELTINKLMVQNNLNDNMSNSIIKIAKDKGIRINFVSKDVLDKKCQGRHQGFVCDTTEFEYGEVDEILNCAKKLNQPPFIVILDGITDPHNLGALIRCAEGVGAHGLIIPKRRAVGLTPVVTKASCGAIEHLAIAKVTNIAATVDELKEQGVWIFSAEAGGAAYYDTDFKCPCAIVLGSEGEGVSKIVKDRSDYITSIPMYGKVNSFNVSTAAAVILAEVSRQHRS